VTKPAAEAAATKFLGIGAQAAIDGREARDHHGHEQHDGVREVTAGRQKFYPLMSGDRGHRTRTG